MSHPITSETLQRLLRARICTGCPWRPARTKSLSPDVPRACEGRCPVFARLDALHAVAKYRDPMVGSTVGAVRRLAGPPGKASERAEHDVLAHHQEEIVSILQKLASGHAMTRAVIRDRPPEKKRQGRK